MKKDKLFLILTPVIIVLFIGVIFFPQLIESIGALVTGQASSCEDTPYDPNCFCLENERKVSVPWLGIPKWSCENVEQLLIDPESETFEDDAILFSQNYLTQFCGSTCTDLSCGNMTECVQGNPVYPEEKCIEANYSWSANGARMAVVRCIVADEWNSQNQPTSGYMNWEMDFFVESEDETPNVLEVFAQNNSCLNSEKTMKCTHQSVCDYYIGVDGSADWCIGDLPLDVFPSDYPLAITGGQTSSSGFGSPLP